MKKYLPLISLMGALCFVPGLAGANAAPLAGTGGSIAGTVRGHLSGAPLDGATVEVLDQQGETLAETTTAAGGTYSFSGLAPGQYYLLGFTFVDELAIELWPNAVWLTGGAPIPLEQAQLVAVKDGVTITADFSLDTMGIIAGRVIDAETGSPVAGGRVKAQLANSGVDGSTVDENGDYRIVGMNPGTWVVITTDNPNHIEKVHGGANCEADSCDPFKVGTPVEVRLNQPILLPDLALSFGPGLAGTVRLDGVPADGVPIDVFDAGGNAVEVVTSFVGGRFRLAIGPGSFYLASRNGQGYLDQIYDGVVCPKGPAGEGLCDPQDGILVEVDPLAPARDGLDFDLAGPGSLFRDGFESGDFGGWWQVAGNWRRRAVPLSR